MTTVAEARLGMASVGASFLPAKRNTRSRTARANAEIAIRSGEKIRSGSDVRKRARNAISTVSQIGSQPELAPELDPSRLFHQGDLLLHAIELDLQLFRPGYLLRDIVLGLAQQLDGLGELAAFLFEERAVVERPARLLLILGFELPYLGFVCVDEGASGGLLGGDLGLQFCDVSGALLEFAIEALDPAGALVGFGDLPAKLAEDGLVILIELGELGGGALEPAVLGLELTLEQLDMPLALTQNVGHARNIDEGRSAGLRPQRAHSKKEM